MIVLYLYALVLFSRSTKSFFLSSPTTVPPKSLACYVGEYVSVEGICATDYTSVQRTNYSLTRLCAFQEDQGLFNASNFLHHTYTASSITNIFRQMVHNRCQGFSNTSDLGYGSCTPQSFELYTSTSLCICATDFCNRDFATCQQSVISSSASPTLVPQVVPLLTTPVSCYENTLSQQNYYPYSEQNVSSTCIPSYQYSSRGSSYWYVPNELINQTMCETYTRANSVLCAVDGSVVTNYYTIEDYGYLIVTTPHMIRYTAEDYIGELLAPLNYDSAQYSNNNTYAYGSNTPNVVNTIYEGSTNVVIRQNTYDLVGNLLDISTLICFCSTNNCNVDFGTCASGINYNSTSSSTIGSTPSTTTGSSTIGSTPSTTTGSFM